MGRKDEWLRKEGKWPGRGRQGEPSPDAGSPTCGEQMGRGSLGCITLCTRTHEHTLPRESCSTLAICHRVSYSVPHNKSDAEQGKEMDPAKLTEGRSLKFQDKNSPMTNKQTKIYPTCVFAAVAASITSSSFSSFSMKTAAAESLAGGFKTEVKNRGADICSGRTRRWRRWRSDFSSSLCR